MEIIPMIYMKMELDLVKYIQQIEMGLIIILYNLKILN